MSETPQAWTRLRIVMTERRLGRTTVEGVADDGSTVPLPHVEAVDLQFPASWRKRSGLHRVSVPTPSEPPLVKAATPTADSVTRRVAEEFQVGDVVTLKSGGGRWTVTRRPSDEQLRNLGLAGKPEWIGGEWLVCSGNDGKWSWAYMPRATLVKVHEPGKGDADRAWAGSNLLCRDFPCVRCLTVVHVERGRFRCTNLCDDCFRKKRAK